MKPLALLLILLLPGQVFSASNERQVAELKQLRTVLPRSEVFEQWLQKYGYLPPDFDKLPSTPYPEDLLTVTREGKPHHISAAEWPERRKELSERVEEYLLGHAPPPPDNVRGVIEEKNQQEGHEVWTVRLEFGPDHGAQLHCWLWIPANLASKPAPVYLVDNTNYAAFARDAFDQGQFLICIYNAADPAYRLNKKDESEAYQDLFGKYDWSEFRRRGWSASRAVDWLCTLDFVDRNQIYIGGHSRSAKQALACAAFDERIAGVVASSPGSGGSLQFRYCDQYYYDESAERLSTVFPLWVLSKVRFFAGRENKLPADMHFVYALIAPRPVLMSTAINDNVESTWAVEQMYAAIAPVWKLLGKADNLALRYRPGQHHPDPATYAAHSQFLLLCSQGKSPASVFPFQPYHPWDYNTWVKKNPPPPKPAGKPTNPAQTRQLIQWLLGDGPTYGQAQVQLGQGESDATSKILSRLEPAHLKCRFGEVNGNFYYPSGRSWTNSSPDATSAKKLPTIILLAPLHCSSGYTPEYRTGDIPYLRFAKAGFLVLAFDPIATGSRQEERRQFYELYPHWSLMGQMVLDTRHAIDAALANPDADATHISLVGFGMGGMVATLTAAMDERASAVVSASGFTAFRTDNDAAGTGGVRRWSHLYGWLPRLGQFVGREADIPVDFDDVLAAIAPRRMLVVAPLLDWHFAESEVSRVIEAARPAYNRHGAADKLELYSPECLTEFNNDVQSHITDFLSKL